MSFFFTHFQKIASGFSSFLFPSFCYGCGNEGALLCATCQTRVPLLPQTCFACHKNATSYGQACLRCKTQPSSLDAVFGAYCYSIPVIKKLIHGYKYHFIIGAEAPLRSLFEKGLLSANLPLPDIIVPVPLHPRRLRYRGFNQSLFLATVVKETFSSHTTYQILEILQRNRSTQPQQKTSNKQERLTNLKDAFAVTDSALITNKVIWLIDDVATTNATLEECAKVLKNAGAKKIYGVVFARN